MLCIVLSIAGLPKSRRVRCADAFDDLRMGGVVRIGWRRSVTTVKKKVPPGINARRHRVIAMHSPCNASAQRTLPGSRSSASELAREARQQAGQASRFSTGSKAPLGNPLSRSSACGLAREASSPGRRPGWLLPALRALLASPMPGSEAGLPRGRSQAAL